ncbi:hypothetical protein SLA2020_339000 [Shorea laevis]
MADSQPDPNFFSVRIVSIDYYMAPPIPGLDICYSSFHGGKVNEVPIIRIYGSTPAGQKTCLHVHRVRSLLCLICPKKFWVFFSVNVIKKLRSAHMQYSKKTFQSLCFTLLYVPCTDISLQSDKDGDAYTHAVSVALEKVLKLKGNAGSKRLHVHGCSLVRAKKFYGYHSSEELFVKIYLYYPHDVSRAANLLLSGAVLDKSLQPHESHIPFILQFLVDYNLYGMGHMHLSKMKFRHPVPDAFSLRKCDRNG